MVDFDNLIDVDIDPRQDGNYLKLNVDHIEKISTVHIRLNICVEVLGLLLIILVYFFTSLVYFDVENKEEWHTDSNITALRVYSPAKNWLWYWQFKFDDDVTCENQGFIEGSSVCAAVHRSWIANTLLNAILIFGILLTSFSIYWSYCQLHGYFHKMNVSLPKTPLTPFDKLFHVDRTSCWLSQRSTFAFSHTSTG